MSFRVLMRLLVMFVKMMGQGVVMLRILVMVL